MQCPPTRQFQDLVSGELAGEDCRRLVEHLDTCEKCQSTLATLCGEGSLASMLATVSDGMGPLEVTELDKVIDRLKQLASDESVETDEEFPLDFLRPPRSPEHLGCLDSYDVLEVIGHGGMGIVLKAHDPKLDRVLAIKVLSPSLTSNARARKRFLREARAAAAVSHDHVVAIHAVGETEGLPYLVMEYVSGCSLQSRIDAERSLPVEDILRIARQTASGLAAAHDQGLIHRDIKPANILLENHVERVKITDFGLARSADDVDLTRSGVVAGTPEYMSPEQAGGKAVDARCDLFSLGGAMYSMCTGRPPVVATGLLDAMRQVCDGTPPPIQDIEPTIPDWLVEIVERLLSKSPEDRFQTATDVADLLEQHLAHVRQPDVIPQPPRLPGPARRGSNRRWWLIAAATLLLVGGLMEVAGVTTICKSVTAVIQPNEKTTDEVPNDIAAVPPEPVDVLRLVEPERDALNSSWKADGAALVSSHEGLSAVQLPYVPPEEYDLEVDVERLSGNGYLAIGLVISGMQAAACIDGRSENGHFTALNQIDMRWGRLNPMALPGTVFFPGSLTQVAVQVRKNSVRVTAGERTLIDWSGASQRLSERPIWSSLNDECLFLGCHEGSFRITRLKLTPVSSEGRPFFLASQDDDIQHIVAEQVLWKSGRIRVSADGSAPLTVDRIADLPKSFRLVEVTFRGHRALDRSHLDLLSGLDRLDRLDLANSSFNDQHLAPAPNMPETDELDLSHTSIRDVALTQVRKTWPGVRRLVLSGTTVSDEAATHLAAFTRLEQLDLRGTQISDVALERLGKLAGLKRLVLDHTNVSDEGMRHLQPLSHLEALSLAGTKVSDRGLQHLYPLRRLREVSLAATQATAEGIDLLQQGLPECCARDDPRHAVNLLALIEPGRDFVQGEWEIEGDELVSPAIDYARIRVPFTPPKEYTLELVVARRSGNNSLVVGFLADGIQPGIVLDGWSDTGISALGTVRGKRAHNNETTRQAVVFGDARPLRVLISIRQGHIIAACDGRVLIDWRGEPDQLSLYPMWAVPAPDQLFLGAFQSRFAISEMRLTPHLSGR